MRDIASFPFDYLGLRGQFKTPSNFQNLSSELQSPENRDQELSISCTALNGCLNAAFPADFCVSSPRERPFQRVPGPAGGCFLAELVGSLQLNSGCSQGGKGTLRASASSAGSKLEDGEGRRGQGLVSILSIAFICWSL